MNARSPIVTAIVVLCFFVSGAAGLIYQTVWARYLGLFLGHTSYAVIAVLVAFMGGLAIGNAWLGGFADRCRKPLALYAFLEVGIGIYALIFPHYYEACHQAYVSVLRSAGAGGTASLALKFLFSLLTILIPTVLMGATFPALTRFVTRQLSDLREKVALLYAINSGGAVAGCLLADFWLIPSSGLEATLYAAALCNLLPGLVCFYLSKRTQEGMVEEPGELKPKSESVENFKASDLRMALVCIGASGFVAMLYEVVWTRLLALALGSSTHAFSLMLVTFISGITAGALIVSRWKRVKDNFKAFAWAELALAGTLLVSMFFYEYLPYAFVRMASHLNRQPESYVFYSGFQLLLCFAVMFIPTLCLGITLPLVSRISTREISTAGGSIGRVFAFNTLGTVLGAALTGLFLLPFLGLARTLAAGISLNFAIGLWILLGRSGRLTPALAAGGMAAALIWIWTAGNLFQPAWQRAFTTSFWRTASFPKTFQAYRDLLRTGDFVYYKDGAGSTVSVNRSVSGDKTNLWLKVNGKTDASTSDDMRTQILVGQIPLLLKPDVRQALVVGLGCGVTSGTMMTHDSLETLDVVEISPDVVEAARLFKEFNNGVLESANPRLRLHVEDAKSFLLGSDKKYDVIVSEPSNPWMAGVAAVFSLEFYRNCASRLATNGLMIQWVQVYESNDQAFGMVLNTFSSVFPHVSIWQGWLGDLMLVGSINPPKDDLAHLKQSFNKPAIKAELGRIGINSIPVLLSHQLVSSEHGMHVTPADAEIHSDLFPRLEYVAQKAFFVRQAADRWRVFDENYHPRSRLILADYLKANPLTDDDYWSYVDYYMPGAVVPGRLLRSLFLGWRREKPESDEALAMLTRIADPPQAAELFTLRYESEASKLKKISSRDRLPIQQYASSLMQTYRDQRSIYFIPDQSRLAQLLNELIQIDPDNQRVYRMQLAELAWDRGEDENFLKLASDGFNPDASKFGPVKFQLDARLPAQILRRMIESLWSRGKTQEALALGQQAILQGYVGPRATSTPDPWLEAVVRKLAINTVGSTANSPAPSPRN